MKHFATSSLFATDKVRKYYEQEERESHILDQFFSNCFDYLRANAVNGDYAEFGSGFIVRSFRLAAKYRSLLFEQPHLFAFDSFAGLPPIKDDEAHPGWKEGAMAVSMDEFRALMQLQGLEQNEYRAIPGLFQKTLALRPTEYGMSDVCFAFVDCDLYESTICVLPFLAGVLSDGAILAFDDWNTYKGNPSKGQRRALSEFLAQNPKFSLVPFLSFGWHGQSFLVHRSS
ncbi:MAG TPA: TylF/MycF/NovP-related O-methyltransferase [Lacunisphaera sp.]|nr:TylF/MycF/NovP-related O-methyltransferase [Lacunisphaera sp.]